MASSTITASNAAGQTNTCFVSNLRGCLAKFEDLRLKVSQSALINGSTTSFIEIFNTIEVNDSYAVISITNGAGTSQSTLILIENEVKRMNSPVYIYVDDLEKFDKHFYSNYNEQRDIELIKFTLDSSPSVSLSHISIDQLDLCFIDSSISRQCGIVSSLIARWVISRVAKFHSIKESEDEISRQKRRDDVIAAALHWSEKRKGPKRAGDDGADRIEKDCNVLINSDNSDNSNNSSSSNCNKVIESSTSQSSSKQLQKLSNNKPASETIKHDVSRTLVPPVIDFKKYYGRRIDSIFLRVFNQGEFHPITANSPAPIPFSTEYFEGRILFMLNTVHSSLDAKYGPDLYAARFEGPSQKYTFDFQIQGRFLKEPPGHLFFGAEITKKMELGLLTRTTCNGLMSFAKAINNCMHFSFGDSEGKELPHIAAPLWSTLDKLVVTPSAVMSKNRVYENLGLTILDEVPDIGGIFEESNEARSRRRKDLSLCFPTDAETVFSMSFKSSQLEWVKWKLVNVPLMGNFDLHSFWSDADIRLCLYSAPVGTEKSNLGKMSGQYLPVKHLQSELKHHALLHIQHISNHPEFVSSGKVPEGLPFVPQLLVESQTSNSCAETEREASVDINIAAKTRRASLSLVGRTKSDSSDEELEINSESGHIDGRSKSGASIGNSDSESENEDATSAMPPSHVLPAIPTDKERSVSHEAPMLSAGRASSASGRFSERDRIRTPSADKNAQLLTSYMQIPLVMASIEIDDRRASRRYGRRIVYAFLESPIARMNDLNNKQLVGDNKLSGIPTSARCVLRTYKEFTAVFPVKRGLTAHPEKGRGCDGYYYGQSGPKPLNLGRLAETEVRLNELDAAYRDLMRQCAQPGSSSSKIRDKLQQFLHSGDHTGSFLGSDSYNWISKSSLRTGLSKFVMESLVITKLSNSYWSEELLGLTTDNVLVFIKSTGRVSKDQRCLIHISGILSVTAVDGPFDHGFMIGDSVLMKITTFSRDILIMMRGGPSNRDKWIGLLLHKMNEWNISQNTVSKKSIFGNGSINGDLGKIALISSHNNRHRRHHLDFLIKPKSWNLGEKDVLNGRIFTVGALDLLDPNNRLVKYVNNPAVLVEKLLQLVLQLCEASKNNKFCNALNDSVACNISSSSGSGPSTPLSSDFLVRNGNFSAVNSPAVISTDVTPQQNALPNFSDEFDCDSSLDVSRMSENVMSLWIEFLDGVSLLQSINLNENIVSSTLHSSGSGGEHAKSSEAEDHARLAFFLNLYHLLLLHAFLILGLPQNTSDFVSIFTKVAYEISGDILTLSELEHCVIRNNMTRPSVNFIAQSYIPSHKYPFSLTCRRDFRLIFALNCGSYSNFPYITIYRGSTLSQQLDATMELSLENQMQISVEGKTVVLPQAIQWFLKDFEIGLDGMPCNRSLLSVLSSYTSRDRDLGNEVAALLLKTNGGKTAKISYSQFTYKCRFLEGYNSSGFGFPHC